MPSESPFTLAALLEHPHEELARMRAQGSLADLEDRTFVVHYEAVRKMLQDGRLSANFTRILEFFGVHEGAFHDFMMRSPLNMDGPEHRAWRKLMVRTFTPRNVDQLRPFLRIESERLVSEFAARGECEFVGEFARHLPALGLCELIGVPKEDRMLFGQWADTIGLGFNPMLLKSKIADVDAAMAALIEFCRQLVSARQAAPQDDLVSRLAIAALDQETRLDHEAVARTVAGLVFAGYETTKNQLGGMIMLMADAPDQWEAVAREPSRAQAMVEETLRMHSAVANISRTVNTDIEWEGRCIPVGTRLVGSIWAANRDENQFPAPNRLDPETNGRAAQIAFGQGAHHCLGAALARAELQEALIALSKRLHCPRVLPAAEYLPPLGITGPTKLPLTFQERR